MRAASIVSAVLRTWRQHVRRAAPGEVARCRRFDVRSEADLRTAAFALAPTARQEVTVVQAMLRDLVALNTPALYLNVVQRSGPVRVILRPWAGRTLRFRGHSYFLEAGAEAPDGIEAFLGGPLSHITTLYPTAPDHPVYALSIEHQGEREIVGEVPSYVTNVTIVVNGRVVTRGERLLHERGPQIWAA